MSNHRIEQNVGHGVVTEIWQGSMTDEACESHYKAHFIIGHVCCNWNDRYVYHFVHEDFFDKDFTCSDCREEFTVNLDDLLDDDGCDDNSYENMDIRLPQAMRDFASENFLKVAETRARNATRGAVK